MYEKLLNNILNQTTKYTDTDMLITEHTTLSKYRSMIYFYN